MLSIVKKNKKLTVYCPHKIVVICLFTMYTNWTGHLSAAVLSRCQTTDFLSAGRFIARPRKSRSSDIVFRPTFVQLTRWVVGHFLTVV